MKEAEILDAFGIQSPLIGFLPSHVRRHRVPPAPNQPEHGDFNRLVIQNCRSAGQLIGDIGLQHERDNLSFMDEFLVHVPGLTPEI